MDKRKHHLINNINNLNMKNYIIYKYVSPSEKCYIGQTCHLKDRQRRHQSKHNRCYAFRDAIIKYGYENFKFEILEENLTLDEENIKEEYYISFYNSLSPNGYNLKSGGLNNLHAEETKRKIANGRLGENNPFYGKKHSAETIEKIKKANLGKTYSEESINKLSKKYIITFPDGTKKEILNLAKFCRENGLKNSTMCGITAGRVKSHKGYKCQRL